MLSSFFDLLYNKINGFKKAKNAEQLKEIVKKEKYRVDVKLDGVWLTNMPKEIREKVLCTSDQHLDNLMKFLPHRYKELKDI